MHSLRWLEMRAGTTGKVEHVWCKAPVEWRALLVGAKRTWRPTPIGSAKKDREKAGQRPEKNAAESDTEWSSEAITKSTELRQMSNFCIPNEEQLKSGMHAMANVVGWRTGIRLVGLGTMTIKWSETGSQRHTKRKEETRWGPKQAGT